MKTDLIKRPTGGIDGILNYASRHPYIMTIILSLLMIPFCFGQKEYVTLTSLIFIAVLFVIVSFFAFVVFDKEEALSTRMILFVTILAAATGSVIFIYANEFNIACIFISAVVVLALIGIILYINKSLNTRNLIILIMVAGFVLRLCYVLYTTSNDRQHDVGFFNWTWGHANYIEYWYNNGLKLPDFDVRMIWQYYHPPLHHMIMALLLKALTMLGVEYDKATAALQILPLMYSTMCVVCSYKIFKRVNLKGVALVTATAIICFHPTFTIMAGSYNNDILSVLFILLAVIAALKWYDKSTMKNIIPVAVFIGLGMMTKLSVWMVAPAVAYLFIVVLIKCKEKFVSLFAQYCVFGVICVPLALWWQVTNLIKWNVPLTYVPYLSKTDAQNLGNLSVFKRLFDFGNGQLSTVYDCFTGYGAAYNEYNPTIGLFKTATFDEGTNQINDTFFPSISVTGPMLFWLGVVVFLIGAIAFIVAMTSKKCPLTIHHRVFYSIIFVVFVVSYYAFCFEFPFTCTQNIRYCVPLIPLCAMGVGYLVQALNTDSTKAKSARYSIVALCSLFCVMSAIVYIQVGIA